MTKAGLLEHLALQSPPPKPPEPPKQRDFTVEPPLAEILPRSKCNGGSLELARREVLENIKTKIRKISILNPVASQKIADEVATIAESSRRYHEIISASFNAISEMETALIDRASTLHQVAADSELLAAAQAALESRESLEMSGEQLIVFEQRRKKLPGKIAEAEKVALELELKIQKISTEIGISVPAIVAEIVRSARDPDGRIADSEINRLVPFLPVP